MAISEVAKGISGIVGALTDPIIVHPGGWGDSLPDWIKHAITMERLIMNMASLKGEEPTGTDAEACAYLFTASLTQPVDSDWTDIYLYIADQVYTRHRTKDSGVQFPEDIRVKSLNQYQMGLLQGLKDWIYEKRARMRQEKGRAERREKRAEEVEQKRTEQAALF